MSTVLYNRKEGRQVGQVAKQQVASLETNDPILGFQATNERLFVLTTKNLFNKGKYRKLITPHVGFSVLEKYSVVAGRLGICAVTF